MENEEWGEGRRLLPMERRQDMLKCISEGLCVEMMGDEAEIISLC